MPLQLFAKQQLKYKYKTWFIESILNAKWRYITELDSLTLGMLAKKVILIQYDFMSVKFHLIFGEVQHFLPCTEYKHTN